MSVSLFQAIVLLLFNNQACLTFSEIQKSTGIDTKELTRTMQSLACSKVRLLTKDPKGKDISSSDQFVLNSSFSNPHYRIKVNAIQIKETEEERGQTEEKVFQDRVYVVDAAVVRIMKTRKSLRHEELIGELCSQLKFQTQVSFLLCFWLLCF